MSQNAPVTAIIGAGPGLGAALARRFAAGGHAIALLSRSAGSKQQIADKITSDGGTAHVFKCDSTRQESLAAAFGQVRDELGTPDVLLYNAGYYAAGGILDMPADYFEYAWRINCLGGFMAVREVAPDMLEQGAGTILFTGATAAMRGGAGFGGFAVGKSGLRTLSQSMAREFGPHGVHVAHVVVDGQIGPQRPDDPAPAFLDPDAIAENYWHLHQQPRTAWTQELDLRPYAERF